MRVTAIEDTSLAGLTYKEVVDKLKSASRPVRIRFADVAKGTVEEQAERDSKQEVERERSTSGNSSAYLQQKREFTRVLVTGELHTEMWTIENKKLLRDMVTMKTKWNVLSSAFDVLNARRMELRKENDQLKSDKDKYETMLKNLKLQESYVIENPELVRANELARRNAELTEDINKMSAGNKRLRKERMTLQSALDELEKQLSKVENSTSVEEDKAADEEFFGFDPNSSSAEQLAAAKKKRRAIEEELVKEQRKASKVLREMEQLNKHYASLTGTSSLSSSQSSTSGSTSTASGGRTSREEKEKSALSASSSGGDKPSSEIADLEAKILELRKKQRSVVDTLSKAAQAGDHKLAKECQRKRQKIKEDLKNAQDLLHQLKTQGSSGASSGSAAAPSSASAGASDSAQSSRRRNASTASASGSAQNKERTASGRKMSVDKPRGAKTVDRMPTLSGFLDKGPTEWSDGRGLISNIKSKRGARERWCEITPEGLLKYYKRRNDSEVRGEINLGDRSFELVCEDFKRGKEFILSTDSQQSHFYTKDTQEMQIWVTALRDAVAYLKAKQQQKAQKVSSSQAKKDPLDALARKAERSEAETRRGNFTIMGMGDSNDDDGFPEDDSQFYGRATLGF